MAVGGNKYEWRSELYSTQDKSFWPWRGRHILAQYDDDTIVVYQAFNSDIADFAVNNQRLGGDYFSYDRMSWIKTNFLWMMYRCGWARKKNQDRVLAIRLPRSRFNEILSNAFNSKLLKSREHGTIRVRLQWDPDHAPCGERVYRRAIQLGLKGDILRKYGNDWIVQIDDVTDFIREQCQKIFKKNTKKYLKSGEAGLLTARERVYPVTEPDLIYRLELDFYEEKTIKSNVKTAVDEISCRATMINPDDRSPDNDHGTKTNSSEDLPPLENYLDKAHLTEDGHLRNNDRDKTHLTEDGHSRENDCDQTQLTEDGHSHDNDRDKTHLTEDGRTSDNDRDGIDSTDHDLSWDSLYPD